MFKTPPRSSLDEDLRARLDALESHSIRRQLRPISSGIGPRIVVDGRSILQFCSNDYLGITSHPAVTRAAEMALSRYGTGAGSARLVVGTSPPHCELEEALAQLKQTEAALALSSGYHANTGVLPALAGSEDRIFSDALNHASIIDGCRLSRAATKIYRHNDVEHLTTLLSATGTSRRRVIVTESVFAMDGDLAPLSELASVAKQYDALLVVDEAHATGVFGSQGGGLVQELELGAHVDVQIGTLSKAIGALGGYVAGSQTLIDTLINEARTFIYTTALPPSVAASATAAIQVIIQEPERREQLWQHARFLRKALAAAGYHINPGNSPILPVMVGDAAQTVALSNALLTHGVLVSAIRPPTVPTGTARLRVTPMATHTENDLEQAVDAFIAAGRDTDYL
ncbi:MAG TPA: 8-amino-7-oxononanoate synthase [Acidobacteria bacterium]|nr:8-amino-7-oxononanoate synthase [Acidobacteriota bacterium]